MLTGEAFKRVNHKRDTRLENTLEEAKEKFTNYAKNAGAEDFSFDKLNQLEKKVERLDYLLWCANYNK